MLEVSTALDIFTNDVKINAKQDLIENIECWWLYRDCIQQ